MNRLFTYPLLGASLFGSVLAVDKPNVMVFLVDDMGVMDTSVPFLTDENGQPKAYKLNALFKTPSMERLAKLGVRFNQFCAQSVCSPSRASIMTGQNATRHQTTQWIKPDGNNRGPYGPPKWNWEGIKRDTVTLPRILKSVGYHSIHVGKAHFGPKGKPGADPLTAGFDVNIAGHYAGRPESYLGEKNYGKGLRQVPGLEKYHGTKTFLSEAITIEAKEAVSKAVKADKPFFLHMSHYAVHGPFNIDQRFIENYQTSSYRGKPLSRNAKGFATLIEGMDKSLGDLMDHFEKEKIAEDTLIIFLGDNGTDAPLGKLHDVSCAAPLRGKKGTHYEGGMRVPFIAAWVKPNPNNKWQKMLPIKAGAIQGQVASVNDLLPTITDLAGAKIPSGHKVDGRNLKPLLTGERSADWEEQFLMHFPHQHRSSYFTSYRDADWKVVYHYPCSKKHGYELFHLKKDPYEQKNLADTNNADLKRMMEKMIAQLEKEGALYPVDENGKEMRPKLP